jgi:hypothetical protein
MITASLIVGFIFLFISLLLTAPVIIHIDTDKHFYSLRIPLLFSTRLEISEQGKRLNNRVFFIPFSLNLDNIRNRGVETVLDMKTDQRPWYLSVLEVRPGHLGFYLNIALQFIHSFRLKRLSIEMDTGDYTLNARLIPFILIARRQNIDISVNFIDNNNLIMIIENRIYRLIWQVIKFYFNNKKN